jgi:hypothetical protein
MTSWPAAFAERHVRGAAAAFGLVVAASAPALAQAPTALSDSAFARLVSTLSEAPGYFDTDNLISNEDSYLHVVGTLKRLGVTGGTYIGVGPDQNFAYIAAVRPRIAFIVDIRRDNLLHHLLLKSLFALSRNRIEYVCLLFGRDPPADTSGWSGRTIGELLAFIDRTPRNTAAVSRVKARVLAGVRRSPVPLTLRDVATISRFHDAFIAQGPALRFNTLGRAPQPYYPDYRRLLAETDLTGRQSGFLAHEADFRTVKSLQDRNLVVPIVGDFAGARALPAIGSWMQEHGETLSAFYTSNVEQYLFRSGTFTRFAASVSRLSRSGRSVMLRSYFQGGHPQQVAGYHATQVAQFVDRFAAVSAAGGFASYRDLVTRDVIRR